MGGSWFRIAAVVGTVGLLLLAGVFLLSRCFDDIPEEVSVVVTLERPEDVVCEEAITWVFDVENYPPVICGGDLPPESEVCRIEASYECTILFIAWNEGWCLAFEGCSSIQ